VSAYGDYAALARLVDALRPYLDDLTLVGGWAHRLYPHFREEPPPFEPLTTEDADVATPIDVRVREGSLAERLQRAGFVAERSGDGDPPVEHYRHGDDGGFTVEFLCSQGGSGVRKDGTPDGTVDVAGVTAQRLRYLEILSLKRWTLTIGVSKGFPLEDGDAAIHLPNPVSYLVQKVLVLHRRKPGEQPKDVLYVHDTLLMFAASLEGLRPLARDVLAEMHPGWVTKFHERRARMFAAVNDNLIGAAEIAKSVGRARPSSPQAIQAVCLRGFAQLFD